MAYYAKRMEKYFDKETYRFEAAALVFRHNKYFLHIPVAYEVDKCLDSDICNVVGIDRGINFVVATYDFNFSGAIFLKLIWSYFLSRFLVSLYYYLCHFRIVDLATSNTSCDSLTGQS